MQANRIKEDGDAASRETLKPSNCVAFDGNKPLVFRYRFTDQLILSGFSFKSIVDDAKAAAEHGRVQTLVITTEAGTARVDLKDTLTQTPIGSERRIMVGRPVPTSPLLLTPIRTAILTVTVQSVFAGTKFKDVCFAGFTPYEAKAERRRGTAKDYE